MTDIMRQQLPRLVALLGFSGLIAFPFLLREWVNARYATDIVDVASADQERAAIVFGAAVYRSGRLSPMLRDRVETAVRLYQDGTVERLLFSGDRSGPDYNEPGAMMAYAVARGVPAAAIEPDYGGHRTYDTCYRARHIYGLTSAILVTQDFHLPRALFTCSQIGIIATGVPADMRDYHPRSLAWSQNRELLALVRALWDVLHGQPASVLGPPRPL
jgi:SanA protein